MMNHCDICDYADTCEEHSDGWGDNIVYVDEDDYCSFGISKEGAEE